MPSLRSHRCTCRMLCSSSKRRNTSFDHLADPQIWVFLDPVPARLDVTDRHRQEKFAPSCLLLQGFDRAGPQDRKFQFAHRALHAEQQPVIGVTRFVDAVLIDDERSDKAAKLDERMPVPAIAGQPGGFDGEDRTHSAFADRRQKLLKARTADARP
jgi:hypothetical protein